MERITIGKLAAWLNALGHTVEIRVRPYGGEVEVGRLVVARDERGGLRLDDDFLWHLIFGAITLSGVGGLLLKEK